MSRVGSSTSGDSPLRNTFSQLAADVGRTGKPRSHGLTVVIDTGYGPSRIEDLARVSGEFCDRAKIAWASAIVTGGLEEKVALYRRHDIEPLLGGSLFEYAYLWGKLDQLLSVARELGCAIEISDGVATVPRPDKLRWIETFARELVVFSEVGGKLAAHQLDWTSAIREELSAGARYVVIEGREVGPTGREIRTDLVDEILAAADPDRILFEALERYQQVWFINRLGPNVNLGNIRADDVMVLECFRQGLKEQTMLQVREKHGGPL
jgi:phosphosulfolactate synthase